MSSVTSDPETFPGTERFVVERRLGAGSFGVVYEAFDRERNARVALKTLRSDAARALYRFKREFRALADVAHPNLVGLYELMAEGSQWFFTMERVDGIDFLQYVRGEAADAPASDFSSPTSPELEGFLRPGAATIPSATASRPPSLARLRAALPQLAQGVSALHAAGKLHRDIKPSNVLVTRPGRVVLLDFGLVRELSSAELTHTMEAVGTPAYMSPEQAGQRPLTEASDWYAVGAMLYEALTGRLPFSGRVIDVLRRKQEEDPPAPSTVVPGLPRDLDRLCRDLLRRDPAERPTGPEVLKRLHPAAAVAGVSARTTPLVAPFVGRAAELERLHEAYAMVRAGRATTVVVHGGSGTGKTALVRRFLDELRASEPEAVILSGRCYERESMPYKALDSLLDALSRYLRRLPPGEVEALLPHEVLALARLFPVLRQVPGVVGARRAVLEIPDSQERRRRAFAALRELFVRLADRRPVVLVIDDLQWGDVDSAALLEDFFRPPDSPVVLMIGGYRTEEAVTSPLLAALLPLREKPDAAVLGKVDVEVRELGAEDARAMAGALLGDVEGAEARAAVVARESQGNPFLIDALCRFGGGEPGGGSLDDVIRRRADALPDDARRLLETVAVAGQPLEIDVAARAAGLESGREAALAALRANHLVRTRQTSAREEIEPYHERIRNAVAARLGPEEQRRLNERLAAALLASGRADPERLAAHFQEAGQPDTAAEYAAAAAERAAEALAFDRAARLYELALSLPASPAMGPRTLRVKLAHALTQAGRAHRAAEAYLAAVEGAGPAEAMDLRRRAAEQLLTGGHTDEGLAVLATVLQGVGLAMPPSPRAALASLLLRRAWLRVRGVRFTRRDAARVPAWDLLRIDTCWSVAVGLGVIDMIRAAEFQTRHLRLALRAGEPYRVGRALALEAVYVATGGVRTRGRVDDLLDTARRLGEELHDDHVLGLAGMAAGVGAWVQGRWRDARRLCDDATAVLRERCTGVTWEIMNAEVYGVASLFLLGEIAELSRRVPDLLQRAEERGNLMSATNLRLGFFSHMAWLAADDPEKARAELRRGLAGSTHSAFDFRRIWARGAARDIALYAGEVPEGSAGMDERWRPAASSLDAFAQAGAILGRFSRARWRLARAAAGTGAAERDLARAEAHARFIDRQRTPWGGGLALLVRAGAAATRGRSAEAAARLEEAESRLSSCAMGLLAAAARRRRGELAGGEGGAGLVAEADAWMAAQAVKSPERMTRMLVPGRWTAGPA